MDASYRIRVRELLVIATLLIAFLIGLPACQKAPAEFKIEPLIIQPPEVTPGEPVNITVGVENVGDTEGAYSTTLVLDGISTQTKVINVAPHKTETMAFTVSKDKPGKYDFSVNDLLSSFTVLEPANLIITNLSVTPFIAESGQLVTVSADIINSGKAKGNQSLTLKVDDIQMASKDVTVTSEATEKATFTLTASGVGIHDIEVGALSGTFVVAESGSILFQLDSAWPELAQELLKLPDLKQMDDKKENALKNILAVAADEKNKPAIESMLNEGIKEKRKYCTPLEALLWISYDGNLGKYKLSNDFSSAELVKNAWRNTPTSKNYKSERWQDFDEVTTRLNSPILIATYMNDNIHYDNIKLGKGDASIQTPEETFEIKKGICGDTCKFSFYLLSQNGYTYDEFDKHSNGTAAVFEALGASGFPDGHCVCLYKQNDKFYTIDAWETTVIKGPFSTLRAVADATYGTWQVCGFGNGSDKIGQAIAR
jgi:hypothetical protein